MNLELTYSTLYEFAHYIKSASLVQKLQELTKLVQIQMQDPNQRSVLIDKINEIESILDKSSFYDEQTSVVRAIIEKFNLQGFIGQHLLEKVRKILTQQPSIAATELESLFTSLDKQYKLVNQILVGFQSFKVDDFEAVKPLLAITFPRSKGFSNADKYLDELHEIIKTLGYFQELTGPREEITLFSQSSTDPTVFLSLSIPTIILVGKCIEWALDRIEQAVNIVGKIQEIRKSGFDAAEKQTEVEIIAQFIAKQIAVKIKEIADGHQGTNGRTKNEIEKNAKEAITRLIEHINAGVLIETQATFDDTKPEENASAEEVVAYQGNLEVKQQAQAIKYRPGENSSIPLLERKHPIDSEGKTDQSVDKQKA